MARANGLLRCLCCAYLALGAACGEGEDASPSVDAGADAEEEAVPCTADYPMYQAGLSTAAGGWTIGLVSVDPEPPRQQVPNNWMLALSDGTGAPLTDFKIDNADTFMRVHGHRGRVRPTVELQGEPGQFKLRGLTFQMRGPWEVLFTVVPASGKTVAVQFKICVQ